jgi:heme-degrading monooxygenase HmoA
MIYRLQPLHTPVIVTLTVLHFAPGDRFRAFANMGRWQMQPFSAPGLHFQKMLGTGQNFGLVPDFSRYVFLGVWDAEADARAFFQTTRWQTYLPNAQGQYGKGTLGTLYLQPIRSHGLWDGIDPFANQPDARCPSPLAPHASFPVAVLTRATIRTRKLVDFWRNVPAARARIAGQGEGLLLAFGAGEVPVVQQCTISIWRDAALVEQFAYRQSGHREVVKKTRQRNWYKEELFARFWVLRAEGSLADLI